MTTPATDVTPIGPARQDGPPPLRLVPAPACEPPYDDELPHPPVLRLLPPWDLRTAVAAGTAGACTTGIAARRRPTGPAPAPAAPVVAPAPRPAVELDDDAAVAADLQARRTPAAALPSPHRFSLALLQRLVEVLAGVRPLSQLQRDLSFEAFVDLERAVAAAAPTPGPRPALRAVRSLHVQARPEGVAEVCASVDRGPRRVALAMRIEGRDGAWQVTDLVGV